MPRGSLIDLLHQASPRGDFFSILLALLLGLGSAGVAVGAEITTEEKTTTYQGVVTEVNPSSSTIILRSETSSPRTYTFDKRTVFVDPTGNAIASETVRDIPVTVHYLQEGDRIIVTRVEAMQPPKVIKKESTTTTETR